MAVIVIYLVGIVGLGCWAGIRPRLRKGSDGYFLAGKQLPWPVIGLALFSTNISTVHLVSLAQEGYKNGLAYGNFEWMAAFTLVCLALFFAPFYIRASVSTLPDFLEKRYSRTCRDWLAFVSILSAIFIHIGTSLYAGAVVMEGLFGVGIKTSIIVVSVLTGLYTIVGGLMAVVVTEAIQTGILLAGAFAITAVAYFKIGGWEGLVQSVDPVKLTVLRPSGDASGLPWYSVMLGYPVIGLWYWCADQTIVQRVLGAKDERNARLGALFCGFIKILPVFIFVLPGLLCAGLINKQLLPRELTNSSGTYAFMIFHLMPVGLRGMMAAALLAALMSTVSGALNSIATLFSYDIYKRWRPEASERRLVTVGRVATFVAMIAAMIWSPFLGRFDSIFQGLNVMICYIAPPITAVFVWGVFWKRASSQAAIVTLWTGFALGFITFLLDWFKETTGWNIPFMMSAFYLFVICSLLLVIVSWLRPHQHSEESAKLVWRTPFEALKGGAWEGIGDYRLLSGLLCGVMVLLYIVFR